MEFKQRIIQLLITLMLSIFLVSCSKSPPNTVTTHMMTSAEVQIFMSKANIAPLNECSAVADTAYALPAEEWLDGTFSTDLEKYQYEFKTSGWVNEENDCDDFARNAANFAQVLHHNTSNKLKNTGLLFGEFWYITSTGEGHAINFVVVMLKDAPTLQFYEPQTHRRIVLTTSEMTSCVFWRL